MIFSFGVKVVDVYKVVFGELECDCDKSIQRVQYLFVQLRRKVLDLLQVVRNGSRVIVLEPAVSKL